MGFIDGKYVQQLIDLSSRERNKRGYGNGAYLRKFLQIKGKHPIKSFNHYKFGTMYIYEEKEDDGVIKILVGQANEGGAWHKTHKTNKGLRFEFKSCKLYLEDFK